MISRSHPVVVGVDGTSEAAAAAHAAAAEAAARGLPLRLVRAVPAPEAAHGDRAAAELEQLLRALAPERPDGAVQAALRYGPASLVMTDESRSATLVVVAVPGRVGRVPAALIRWAACPVLAHRPAAGSGVVVGVDGGPGSGTVLAGAGTAAALRNTTLRALHTWVRRSEAARGPEHDRFDPAVDAAERDLVEQYLDPLRAELPDVPVVVDVRHGLPYDALVAASRTAELLVLGRVPLRAAVLATAVTAVAGCPVLLVPVATGPVAHEAPALEAALR
ncbi:universal stress protein [Geodermatophilus ruber]|uniref:Universal stress protein family protein n=1 Tax=Geodermatophilus ruber TaxID=504800 RepID=A0A1I4HM48_9ACTN|nr:universal stress protein [Geodermatophilus ruber]SFL43224.1 Universal stress protein family protein [Geodermatophilus ruber]